MATAVRVAVGQFTSDTTAFTVVASGETRQPTGAIVLCGEPTAIDTVTEDVNLSFGVTDFTTTTCIAYNEEHFTGANDAANASDTHTKHQETNIIEVCDPGTATINRSATVAATTGGITLTPVQSGTQYQVIVWLIFGASCKAFSDGATTAAASTWSVTHGLTNKPKFGICAGSQQNSNDGGGNVGGIGFFTDDGSIKHAAYLWNDPNAVTPSDSNSRTTSSYCAGVAAVGGGLDWGVSVTTNNATSTTFTVANATQDGDVIGLLVDATDVSADVQMVSSPTTAASDWNYNGLSFTSQFIAFLLNTTQAIDTSYTDLNAGTLGVAAMDDSGAEYTAHWYNTNNINLTVSNTVSRSHHFDSMRYTKSSDNTEIGDWANPTFTADGFDVTAANITSMDTTSRKWPMLAISEASEATALPDTRVIVPTGPAIP